VGKKAHGVKGKALKGKAKSGLMEAKKTV